MRILLANYRYFVSGGPERYLFNVSAALAAQGHEVIPFSIRYTRNHESPYSSYFVEPLGNPDEVTFAEQALRPRTIWRSLRRLFYAPDVERAVSRLVAESKPQVAYVLHYLRKLSPSLLVGLKRAGLPVVVRLSDYLLLCPQAHCLRDSQPCTLCTQGNLWPSIHYRCLHRSWITSALHAMATWYHRRRGYFDLIDVFVTTNRFMSQLMAAAGFPERRLRCIPTFVDGATFRPDPGFSKSNDIAYVGRVEPSKGVHLLLEAVALLRNKRPEMELRVRIAGHGERAYLTRLQQSVEQSGLAGAVQFVGHLETPQIVALLNQARVSVVPSLWYENLPNALLESYACGTPVLASNLGSLPECVQDGQTGFLFAPGDATSLAERLEYCLDHPAELAQMGRNARHEAEVNYTPARHIAALETLFMELMTNAVQISQVAVERQTRP